MFAKLILLILYDKALTINFIYNHLRIYRHMITLIKIEHLIDSFCAAFIDTLLINMTFYMMVRAIVC